MKISENKPNSGHGSPDFSYVIKSDSTRSSDKTTHSPDNGKKHTGNSSDASSKERNEAAVNSESGRISFSHKEKKSEKKVSLSKKIKHSGIWGFFKSYTLTIAAILIAAGIVIFVLISERKSDGEKEDKSDNITYYENKLEEIENDSDNQKLISDEEIILDITLPTSSVYSLDKMPLVLVTRENSGSKANAIYYRYSPEGKKLSKSKYGTDGILIEKTVYEAVENDGNKVVIETQKNKKGDYSGYTVNYFSTSDLPDKKTMYTVNGVVSGESIFEYDGNGRVSRETVYTSRGMISDYIEHEYNDDGSERKTLQYDATNTLSTKTLYSYDENGRILKEEYYTGADVADDICSFYNEYTYSEDGLCSMSAYTLVNRATMEYEVKNYGRID